MLKLEVARSRGPSDRCWPISRERKVPKIVNKFYHTTGNNVHQVRGQKVTRPINAETESVSPISFKLGRRLEHALSTAMASSKGLVKLGYCTWAGAYRDGRTRDGHTTASNSVACFCF